MSIKKSIVLCSRKFSIFFKLASIVIGTKIWNPLVEFYTLQVFQDLVPTFDCKKLVKFFHLVVNMFFVSVATLHNPDFINDTKIKLGNISQTTMSSCKPHRRIQPFKQVLPPRQVLMSRLFTFPISLNFYKRNKWGLV